MQNEIYDLVTEAARKAKVARTIRETLDTLELIQEAGAVISGEAHALDFSMEILKLKAALRIAGVEDDDNAWVAHGDL